MVGAMDLPRLIDTPRLHLRDMRPGDADDVFASYGRDPVVLRYLQWAPHESADDSRRQIAYDIHRRLKRSAWVWGLTRQAPHVQAGRVFGQIELLPMSFPSEQAHHLRLGYLMAASHWGQGLMAEAGRAVLDAAFGVDQVWRVDALCDVANGASAAMLARIGMQREGCMRRALSHPNVSDQPRDAWVYALSRDEWLKRTPANSATTAARACADQSR